MNFCIYCLLFTLKLPRMHHEHDACLQACLACLTACEHCATEDIKAGESMAACALLCRDCADYCALSAHLIARDSPFMHDLCQLCAKVCDECAAECEKHAMHHDHCRECAEACRRCAAECRKMTM